MKPYTYPCQPVRGAPETGGAPPRRGPGGDQGHRFHPPPHPGRSYRDGGIRPAPRPGRRRPGLRHARRAAAGLRGRRPALGERGAGLRRQRPHPDSGVEDRPGGRGGGVVSGTGCRRSPPGHPPRRGGDRRGHSGLQPPPRHHPAASAAGSAGGWAPWLAGHHRTLRAGWDGPGPVGCGVRPPRTDDGGTVEVTADAGPLHRAPSSRTGGGGQVLPRAAGGRGPMSQPREAGASEVVAVFGSRICGILSP